jgi:phytoene synthase
VAALAELRTVARRHLAIARAGMAGIGGKLAPAFLTLALVEPHLQRMERRGFDPLHATAELAPWRTQWILWRAARRGRV